ncbi:hypothetical protein BH09ACT8_BH09ACT8_42910 [soil metagenome]
MYWITSLAGSALLGLAAIPRGPGAVAGTAVGCLVVVMLMAIGYTPFLKVGGRVIASHVDDSRPDEPDGTSPPFSRGSAAESYDGLHRADAMWWGVAAGSVVIAAITVLTRWQPGLLFFVIPFTCIIAAYGFDDARRRLPYARGNRLPFIIFGVASATYALLPLLAYLGAYRLGLRTPRRGYGRHSAGRT